nr:uncharacterized protein LOC112023955 [Quercus suber]
MSSMVNRGLLLGLLLLTALSLPWSLCFTDENMKKLTEVRDGKELSGVFIIKQINSPPLPWAKDPSKYRLRAQIQPPPPRPQALVAPQPPPPRPQGNQGHIPFP